MSSIIKEKDIEKIYQNEISTINFLFESDILYKYEKCPKCQIGNIKIIPSLPKIWTCNNYKCRKRISIFKDSFFGKSNIPCNDILRIAYKWLCGQNYSTILSQTRHSEHTITNTIKFLREMIGDNLMQEEQIIGGENIIVEIDESKFGKIKYHRGHKVDGAWVLGGVERTEERRMFLIVVPDRSEKTLIEVLGKYIAKGSIIYSDLWKGYKNLEKYLTVSHLSVNHSQNFKDPETGVHTNSIEGSWSAIKYKIAPRNRTKELIDRHLKEFIWRRQNRNGLWKALLDCLKETKYV